MSYGLMMSLQNTGLAIAPAFIMKLVPSTDSSPEVIAANYRTIELIFAGCAAGAFICTVLLYFVDHAHGGGELSAAASAMPMSVQPSPRLNPLNPRASPFIRQSSFRPSTRAREVIAPKTPHAIRQKYFRKLRIQSHI